MADISRPAIRLRPGEQRAILLFGDLIASAGAMGLALYLWYQLILSREVARLIDRGVSEARAVILAERFIELKIPFWFYLLPLVWLLLMVDSYDLRVASNWRKTLRAIAAAPLFGLLAYSLLFIFNSDPNSLPRIGVGAFLLIASLLTLLWRAAYIRFYTSSNLMRRVLIVGAGKAGQTLAEAYNELKPPPFLLLGYIDDDSKKIGRSYHGHAVLSSSAELLDVIERYRVSDIVVAITGAIKGETFQTILDAQERGVEVTRMPTMYEEITQRVPVHHLESDWVIRSFVDQMRVGGTYELLKRLMDILGGLVGSLIFLGMLPFVAAAIYLESGAPIFYSQERSGKGGRVFKIYKFRSMYQNAEADGKARLAEERDPRITRVGRFIRRTRIDEMPQFISVLTGEMSLVGPRAERPELVAQFQKQIPFYRARLLVKPGLTGWAQINYGYVASVKETAIKLEYDLYYIKHRTLGMDFNIVLRTIGTVLRRTGR